MKKDSKRTGTLRLSILSLCILSLLTIYLNSCKCPDCPTKDGLSGASGTTGTSGTTGASTAGGGPGCGPIYIAGTTKELGTANPLDGTITYWDNTDKQLNIGSCSASATSTPPGFSGCQCNCSGASAIVIATCTSHWNTGIILPTFADNVTADQLPLVATPKTTNTGGVVLTVNLVHTGSVAGYSIELTPSVTGHAKLTQTLTGTLTSRSFTLDAALNHYTISVYDASSLLVGNPVSFTTDKILASGDKNATLMHNYAF